MSLSGPERETTVTSTDDDDLVKIWSAQKRHITKMRKNDRFTEIASGMYGSTEWAEFTIASEDWNPVTGAKRKQQNLSDEQREARRQNILRAQASRHR